MAWRERESHASRSLSVRSNVTFVIMSLCKQFVLKRSVRCGMLHMNPLAHSDAMSSFGSVCI